MFLNFDKHNYTDRRKKNILIFFLIFYYKIKINLNIYIF